MLNLTCMAVVDIILSRVAILLSNRRRKSSPIEGFDKEPSPDDWIDLAPEATVEEALAGLIIGSLLFSS